MLSSNEKLIAVIGATGHQGGGVLRALQASGQFRGKNRTGRACSHNDKVVVTLDFFI